MNYTPRSEDECKRQLLKAGECDFEILKSEATTSKKGNDMIKLTIKCWDPEGREGTVFDYLMDAIPHKLRHAAYACGQGHAYEDGSLTAAHFENRNGRLKLTVKVQEGYDDKNEVQDYVIAETTKRQEGYQTAKVAQSLKQPPAAKAPVKSTISTGEEFTEESIPF
jgi:hypothetical protein